MSVATVTAKQLSHFKANCRSYANVLLRRGKIQRLSCAICGNPKAQMHHTDYTKPEEVFWLCRPCHLDIHKGEIADKKFMAAFNDAADMGGGL